MSRRLVENGLMLVLGGLILWALFYYVAAWGSRSSIFLPRPPLWTYGLASLPAVVLTVFWWQSRRHAEASWKRRARRLLVTGYLLLVCVHAGLAWFVQQLIAAFGISAALWGPDYSALLRYFTALTFAAMALLLPTLFSTRLTKLAGSLGLLMAASITVSGLSFFFTPAPPDWALLGPDLPLILLNLFVELTPANLVLLAQAVPLPIRSTLEPS